MKSGNRIQTIWALTALLLLLPVLGAALPPNPDAGRQQEAAPPPALIYDVEQDKVIRALPNTAELRREAAAWLEHAGGLSGRLRVGANSGIVLRVPFHPPLNVAKTGLSFQCKELLAILPRPGQKESPQLLAFSAEDQTFVFECTYEEFETFLKKNHIAL